MSNVRTIYHEGDNPGDLVVERTQDVEPILEAAHRMHVDGQPGAKDMRHVMTIPAVEVERYCTLAGITLAEWMVDPVHVQRMVSDPNLSRFRTGKA